VLQMLDVKLETIKADLQTVDALVLFAESTQLVTKLRSSFSLIDFNLTCQSFEFINIFRTTLFFNGQQLHIKSFLVCFL